MISIEYANAYTEVLEILKYIPLTEYQKIPKNKITLLEENANNAHLFFYNPVQTLDEQNVSKIAKSIIAIFFRDYWASDTQKENIIKFQKNIRQRLEENKIKKYNPNQIFKVKTEMQNVSEIEHSKEIIVIKKENLISKILNKIKAWLKIKQAKLK